MEIPVRTGAEFCKRIRPVAAQAAEEWWSHPLWTVGVEQWPQNRLHAFALERRRIALEIRWVLPHVAAGFPTRRGSLRAFTHAHRLVDRVSHLEEALKRAEIDLSSAERSAMLSSTRALIDVMHDVARFQSAAFATYMLYLDLRGERWSGIKKRARPGSVLEGVAVLDETFGATDTGTTGQILNNEIEVLGPQGQKNVVDTFQLLTTIEQDVLTEFHKHHEAPDAPVIREEALR